MVIDSWSGGQRSDNLRFDSPPLVESRPIDKDTPFPRIRLKAQGHLLVLKR